MSDCAHRGILEKGIVLANTEAEAGVLHSLEENALYILVIRWYATDSELLRTPARWTMHFGGPVVPGKSVEHASNRSSACKRTARVQNKHRVVEGKLSGDDESVADSWFSFSLSLAVIGVSVAAGEAVTRAVGLNSGLELEGVSIRVSHRWSKHAQRKSSRD